MRERIQDYNRPGREAALVDNHREMLDASVGDVQINMRNDFPTEVRSSRRGERQACRVAKKAKRIAGQIQLGESD
jgi:hypothetical protein